MYSIYVEAAPDTGLDTAFHFAGSNLHRDLAEMEIRNHDVVAQKIGSAIKQRVLRNGSCTTSFLAECIKKTRTSMRQSTR